MQSLQSPSLEGQISIDAQLDGLRAVFSRQNALLLEELQEQQRRLYRQEGELIELRRALQELVKA